MLTITVQIGEEVFDSKTDSFHIPTMDLELEHSLVSLSKWESRWEVPFLSDKEKTLDQYLSYIKYMTLTPNVSDEVYESLTEAHVEQINDYLKAKHTATWFGDDPSSKKPGRPEAPHTAELIYYMMFSLNIPLECEHWHLNRLLTLIRVFNVKNSPPKKLSREEAARRNYELNKQRREQYGTTG